MVDVMLDLETMGVESDAAIVSIGAVVLDRERQTLGEEFYAAVDLQTSVGSGGTISPLTVLWWLKQSEAAREEIWSAGQNLRDALDAFSNWLARVRLVGGGLRLWGNGAAFDCAILESAYPRLGLAVPWSSKEVRCYRTVKELVGPPPSFASGSVPHRAIDDAVHQAEHLLAMLAKF